MAITDHTTAIARAASKGKGRASLANDGQKDVDARLQKMESTHNEVVTAFLRVLSDGKLHDLRKSIAEYADVRSLLEELKLSRQQVKAILATSKEIRVAEQAGTVWLCLESVAKRAAAAKSAAAASARPNGTPTSAVSSSSSARNRATQRRDYEDDEDSVSVAPSNSSSRVAASSSSRRRHRKTGSESGAANSPWALKRPEKQSSSFDLVKASPGRKSLSELALQAGHKPPGWAKTQPSPDRPKVVAHEPIDVDDDESEKLGEGSDLFGGSVPSGDEDDDAVASQTIGRTTIPVPNVPASIRKQPTLPRSLPDSPRRSSSPTEAEEAEAPHIPTTNGSLFRQDSPEVDEFEIPPPLANRRPHRAARIVSADGDAGQQRSELEPATRYEDEDDEDDDPDRTMQPMADDSNLLLDSEDDVARAAGTSNGVNGHTRRSSVSSNRRSRREQEAAMDLDDAPSGDEEQEVADMLTASNGKSRSSGHRKDKGKMPAPMLDGYRAARSDEAGPPGLREKPSRDSSAQDDSALDGEEEEEDVKPKISRSGPTKPGARNRRPRTQSRDEEGSDDDDVVFVTTKRAGASPGKPQKSRQEREAEREARRKQKEAERDSRKQKKRSHLPNWRHSVHEEDEELRIAYDARQEQLGGIAVEDEETSWEVFESFEAPKGKGKRPDYNTVKFWPYHLPYPGRQESEAIVAIAGGCNVRCFRLSEERGVQELWNVVDESSNWEKDECENYLAMAWTHELREGATVSPYWRKWPILLLAGVGKEVKVLDGYTGTTLKVIQGHGGDIYSISVHPTLSHVIATASVDESISLWDISVPVSKPDTLGRITNPHEEDKRRKGYAEGERLCLYGGVGGHVEAVMSIAFHPTLPFLVSGGVDCKLRIWRLPDTLPQYATSSLLRPIPLPQPRTSVRPPCFAFPAFVHASLHSHRIDHVSWVGSSGLLLTRSFCFDSPTKKVIRLFRPTFFDTYKDTEARAKDVVGYHVDYPSEVELFARWTIAGVSDNIGDGVVCDSNDLDLVRGKPVSKRMVYIPTIEPAVHSYSLDTKNKQEDLEEQKRTYTIRLGEQILKDDKRYNAQLRAIDCQPAGKGWMVAVGELEKMVVWIKRETVDMDRVRSVVEKRLNGTQESEEEAEEEQEEEEDMPMANGAEPEEEEEMPMPNGHAEPEDDNDDGGMAIDDFPAAGAEHQTEGEPQAASEQQIPPENGDRSPSEESVEYVR